MKATPALLLLLAFSTLLKAQNFDPEAASDDKPLSDEVQKAIEEFNRMKREGKELKNEVTVVLDAPATDAETDKTKEDEPVPGPDEAILITGKTPEETAFEASEKLQEEVVILDETSDAEPATEPEPAPENKEPGLEIRVESVTEGTGVIDPSQIKLKASFAPKALATPPAGWTLKKTDEAPTLVRSVELQPGTSIALRIQPHILSPESDGINIFSVGEPGFDTALGYQQTQTVSAILGDSVAKLDSDALRLGNAISELHNLLASLPKQDANPETPAE